MLFQRGWDFATWWSLSDWERTEYLAYQQIRNDTIDDTVNALIKGDKYTPETHAMLLVAKI